MAKQVVGLFDSMQDAQGAVQELRSQGFTADDISIVANNSSGEYGVGDGDGGSEAAEGAGAGATGGAVLGGLGGLLVGLGALAIPGIGPVVAAGTLATTLGTTLAGAGLGAAAGGLVGALVGAGIPEEDAGVYAEGVRRGGALVTVQAATDDDADRAADILDRYNVVDIDERSSNFREGGWSGFNENAEPYDRSSSYTSTGSSSGLYSDAPQSEWSESSKVGTAGGTVAGAATGAAMGSVGGPVGTVVGGIAGAVTGAGVGAAGDAAGEAAVDASTGEDDMSRSSMGASGTMSGGRDSAAIGSATDYGTSTVSTGTTGVGASNLQTGTRDITANQGEVAIPIVEEELRVGKREVEQGGVRVSTHVEQVPVNEQVTLRDEQVHVERRAVDQPVDAATVTDAFREGTFEVRETDEQAVVAKEARIVEEVVINKDVQQRTETIQDTVRRTDVDVQEIQGGTRSTGFTETSSTSTSGMSGTGGAAMGGTSSTRYDDVTSTGGDEGPIERTLGDARTGLENNTGIDLDRSGDVGNRDRRDNI